LKAIANIATHPGREKTLEMTLLSIQGQFDEINIYDNALESLDLTDKGKFYYLPDYRNPVYYFTLDDDIFYPADYVEKTINHIDKGGIISYHGRKLLGFNRDYYKGHEAIHFAKGNNTTQEIDVPGTGVMAFRTDYFKPTNIVHEPDQCMVDLLFAVAAAKEDKDIICPIFARGWLRAQEIPFAKTIYGRYWGQTARQNELADLVLALRGR
jgi:hypothetical protein